MQKIIYFVVCYFFFSTVLFASDWQLLVCQMRHPVAGEDGFLQPAGNSFLLQFQNKPSYSAVLQAVSEKSNLTLQEIDFLAGNIHGKVIQNDSKDFDKQLDLRMIFLVIKQQQVKIFDQEVFVEDSFLVNHPRLKTSINKISGNNYVFTFKPSQETLERRNRNRSQTQLIVDFLDVTLENRGL